MTLKARKQEQAIQEQAIQTQREEKEASDRYAMLQALTIYVNAFKNESERDRNDRKISFAQLVREYKDSWCGNDWSAVAKILMDDIRTTWSKDYAKDIEAKYKTQAEQLKVKAAKAEENLRINYKVSDPKAILVDQIIEYAQNTIQPFRPAIHY